MSKHPFKLSAQVGSTMLETLIAILVLSFGMLGMLGLIINSLKMTSTSNYRSIAAEQFTAIAETLIASPEASYGGVAAASATITANCFTTGCAAADISATEYALWQQHLAAVLPGGRGIICIDKPVSAGSWVCGAKTSTSRTEVKICWNEERVSISGSSTCFSAQL